MSQLALSSESQTFLDKNIEQVEDLEILLLLRAEPRKVWDAVEVGHRIGVEPISASNRMMHLFLRGLVDHPESAGRLFQYRHRPAAKQDERSLEELAQIFDAKRMEIVNYLVTRQRKQFYQFADAFRLKDK